MNIQIREAPYIPGTYNRVIVLSGRDLRKRQRPRECEPQIPIYLRPQDVPRFAYVSATKQSPAVQAVLDDGWRGLLVP
jgi:hypothetical protein